QSLSGKNEPLTGISGITTVQQTSTTPIICESHGQRIGTDDMQQQRYHSNGTTIQQQLSERSEHVTEQYQQPDSAASSQIQQHVIPGSSGTGTTSGTQHFPTGTGDLTDIDIYPYHRYDEGEGEGLVKTKSDEIPQTKEISEMRQSRGQVKMRDEEKVARKRDRSFFSELRERLSGRRRSKRRAKSCDLVGGEMEEAVSLPPSRDISRTRFSEKSSSRHDLKSYDGSESKRSTKSLYQHSTLLLQTHENGQKRYYLIPHTILNEPGAIKLLRQGKKLHVYNNHTFVAVKSRSGTTCSVCYQRIGRSNFAKQAYQCRGE
ncbi:unnamed protein product, partial [Acanthocheilonema viteae]